MARKLSIDLGIKSCGFAISDPNNTYSIPLFNISSDKKLDYSFVFKKIEGFFIEYEIDTIILGFPTSYKLSNSWKKKILFFFGNLKSNFQNINVKLINEANSTKITQGELINLRIGRKKRKLIKDKLAACWILQNYLDAEK